jgi:protein-tyrosine phosphatase
VVCGVGEGLLLLIDIHSHLLPNIDDGSQSVERSLAVLEKFAQQGITDVVLTPHVRASDLAIDPEDELERRDVAFALLRREVPERPRLHLGFEIMLDQPISDETLSDRRFALAGSRYYLVEFYMSVASASVEAALKQIVEAGVVPLVAHPERYGMCSATAATRWREMGAKIQVDATTLTRSSLRAGKARQIVRLGSADVLAADNHGDQRSLSAAFEFLTQQGSPEVAQLLTVENTRSVLEDRPMETVPPVAIREGVWSRFKNIIRI